MKTKNKLIIYLNNTIAFLLFSSLRLFLRKKYSGNNILFINTGQIGDLMISTVVLNNIGRMNCKEHSVYFLLRKEYNELYNGFAKDINVIDWNYKKYKYNLFYRIHFLIQVRRLSFKYCFNLTAARGVTVDELALLSGASKIYALNSNFKYLKKLFGEKLNTYYSEILAKNITNEYEKHLEVLKKISIADIRNGTTLKIPKENYLTLKQKIYFNLKNDYLVINPFSDNVKKNWCINKYTELVQLIVNNFPNLMVLMIGNSDQKNSIDQYFSKNKQIINLAGELTIIESAIIVKNAIAFIGNDSGFTHIAKALNINTVAIIGGGSNGNFFPYDIKVNEYYFFHEMDCFGCEWKCKYDEPYCLTEISVYSVFKTIEEVLGGVTGKGVF